MDTTELHESSHVTLFCILVPRFEENLRFSTKQLLPGGRIFYFSQRCFHFSHRSLKMHYSAGEAS